MAISSPVFLLVVFFFASVSNGSCPRNCERRQRCTEDDSGCSKCEKEYYGRQCQHRIGCRYTELGTEYQGIKSVTISGRTCQSWDSQSPHHHPYERHRHNYCRNPDGASDGPWCYTRDHSFRWESCGVPMCDEQCPAPDLNVPYVDVTNPPTDGFTVGFTAQIGCIPGYEPTARTVSVTCQGDKSWTSSQPPNCRIITCQRPILKSHSKINDARKSYIYQDRITIGCIRGYSLHGQSTLTCRADRTWNYRTPTCRVNTCLTPTLNIGSKINHGKKLRYRYQDRISIGCRKGYSLQGQSTLTCQVDRTWDHETPTCTENTCQRPVLDPFSRIIGADKMTYKYLERITIRCITGYSLQGHTTVTCQADKTWNYEAPTCKVNECVIPVLRPNTVIKDKKDVYYYRDNISIVCVTGYTLQGVPELSCRADKKWNRRLPTCKINECPTPKVRHGSYILRPKSVYRYRENVTINCKKGFAVHGRSLLTCQANKTWSSTSPFCTEIECKIPFYSPFVEIENKKNQSYLYKEMIMITCKDGYELQDGNSSVCQSSGEWSKPLPICTRVKCSSLNLTTNLLASEANQSEYSYEDQVSFSCKTGFALSHTQSLVCLSNKLWDKEMPVCIANRTSSMAVWAAGAAVSTFVFLLAIVAIIYWRRKKVIKHVTTIAVKLHNAEYISSQSGEGEACNIYVNEEHCRASGSEQHLQGLEDNTYSYCSVDSDITSGKVQIERLEDYVQMIKKLNKSFFENQYKSLPRGLQQSVEIATKSENHKKNRYKNIYPYDDNRIKLTLLTGIPDSDYINASSIKGYDGTMKYIASQGPQELTGNDFWRMIWEQDVRKIVMLTNAVENCEKKCIQYWPNDGSLHAADTTVQLLSTDDYGDFVIRQLKLIKDEESKNVHQYHFTVWPDKGVPQNPLSLALFHRKVFSMPVYQNNPVLVHCSAGIGRTGTFIALDYLIDEANATGGVHVLNALDLLRQQRVNMVQTLEQYVFLHDVLISALECRSSVISAATFQKMFAKLTTLNKITGTSLLSEEFQKIRKSTKHEVERDFKSNTLETNNQNIRDKALLPANDNQVILPGSNEDKHFMNAVYLPGLWNHRSFIIAAAPSSSTTECFWRMILEENISTIVELNHSINNDEKYWPESNALLQCGNIDIKLLDRETSKNDDTLSCAVYFKERKQVVKIFQAMFWPDTECVPTSTTPMLQFIELIQTWASQNDKGPILVHCKNRADKSGLFSAALTIINQLKTEQEVLIQQTIKMMKNIRPEVIPNMEQFRFCFELVSAYIETFSMYSNFA